MFLFHRDVGKTWTFDSLGLIYLSFLFFFLQTHGKLSRFYYLSNKNIHDTRFAGEPKTEWRKQNLNDVEFTRKNERYNLWYLFGTRWADTANWMQFYENCQNIGKFCVIVTVYCIGEWMLNVEKRKIGFRSFYERGIKENGALCAKRRPTVFWLEHVISFR